MSARYGFPDSFQAVRDTGRYLFIIAERFNVLVAHAHLRVVDHRHDQHAVDRSQEDELLATLEDHLG